MNDLDGVTLVFDLDGTLVDTAPDLRRAADVALAAFGLPPTDAAAFASYIGDGARTMLARAAAAANTAEIDIDALFARFLEHYRAGIAVESRLYPAVASTLSALAGLGATLAVCTNKRTDLSIILLEALSMRGRFAAIVGADAVPQRKPHPAHYLAAVRAAGGRPDRSLMVGDSAADVAAAKAAGAPVIAVAFGYSSVPVTELGADAVISRYEELPDIVDKLLARPGSA
jgi:phosphoglycolate phosphatase